MTEDGSMSEMTARRLSGRRYHGDGALRDRMRRAAVLCARTRALAQGDPELEDVWRRLLPGRHPRAVIVPPLQCDLGVNITLGERAFLNAGCTLLDMGRIAIGRETLLGPGCRLLTPHHPMDAMERRTGDQDAFPVTSGDQCWRGAGGTVCPGGTIGDRSAGAAGSVVTGDIPPDSLAAGSPAKVVRSLAGAPAMSRLERLALERETAAGAGAAGLDAFGRMRLGLPYNARDAANRSLLGRAGRRCGRLNALWPGAADWEETLSRRVPSRHAGAGCAPPLYVDYGDGLVMGEGSFINAGACILDSAMVRLGDHALIGPGCRIATPVHPMDPARRGEAVLYAAPVTIGDDCWLGAGVTVCPGVTIGARSVVAAGSVVTRDIPPDSLAAGRPAVVKRTPADRPDGATAAAADAASGRADAMAAMRSETLYDFTGPDVVASLRRAARLCAELRALHMGDPRCREILRRLIPGLPDSSRLVPPLHVDHGHGLVVGEDVFVNAGCVFLDGGLIRIGDHCRLGPECQICTPQHPMDHALRRRPVETAYPVTIGEDCWLGAGVIVCPGVVIGPRCVVAAGAVVTRDLPPDSFAAGCPAVARRRLRPGERSRLERD